MSCWTFDLPKSPTVWHYKHNMWRGIPLVPCLGNSHEMGAIPWSPQHTHSSAVLVPHLVRVSKGIPLGTGIMTKRPGRSCPSQWEVKGGSERGKTRRGTLPHRVTIYEVTAVPLALALQLFWTSLTYILSAAGSRPLPDMRPSLGQAVALLFARKYLLTRAKHPLLSHSSRPCWALWVLGEAH